MSCQNTYKHGEWNVICDVCGFKKKSSEIRERWDGLKVCKEDWEPRHPQDFLRGREDDQTVPYSRPDDNGTESSAPTYVYTPDPPPSGTNDGSL